MKAEDLYQILELPRGAPPEDIKAAYRRLAKELHPDRRPGDAEAAARFREVSHAYHTLLHVGLRRMYDLHLRHQDARRRSEVLRQEEDMQGLRGLLLLKRGPLPAAATLCAGAALVLLLAAGLRERALQSPSGFWAAFRHVPDWVPGKWRLAELYRDEAAHRRAAADAAGSEPAAEAGSAGGGG